MKETLEGVSMEIPMKCEDHTCAKCSLREYGRSSACVECLAYEVQRLRDEREKNPGVWDKAPNNAIMARVYFYKADEVYAENSMPGYVYFRECPKTKAREIAEKHFVVAENISECEAAINEALESAK